MYTYVCIYNLSIKTDDIIVSQCPMEVDNVFKHFLNLKIQKKSDRNEGKLRF